MYASRAAPHAPSPLPKTESNVIETEIQTPAPTRTKQSAMMAKRSGLVFLSTAAGRVFHFLTQLVLANVLGVAAFGAYTLGFSVLSFLSAMSQAGLHQATVRFIAIGRAKEQPEMVRGAVRFAAIRVVIVSILLGAALVFFREAIAIHVFRDAAIAATLFWVGIVLPFLCGLTWLGFALRGFRAVTAESIMREIANPGVFLLLCLPAMGFKILSPAVAWLALLISTVIALSYGLTRLRKCLRPYRNIPPVRGDKGGRAFEMNTRGGEHPPGPPQGGNGEVIERNLGKEMRRFSIPIWFSRLFTTTMSQGDRLMIGAFSTVAQVGLYHAAYRLAAFQSLAMNSFVPMFSTAIAEAHARDDRATIIYYYRLVVRWALLVTMPIGLICLVFGRNLLHLFGAEFEAALPVLFIVTLASFIDAGVGPAGQFLQMIGRERAASALVIITALLTVGLNVWLIPKYGAVGAAMGTGIGLALLNLGRLLALRKFLGVFPYSRLTLRLLVTSSCAGALAWLAAPLGIFAQAMILLVLYVVGMRFFCLHEDDRAMLERVGKSMKARRFS